MSTIHATLSWVGDWETSVRTVGGSLQRTFRKNSTFSEASHFFQTTTVDWDTNVAAICPKKPQKTNMSVWPKTFTMPLGNILFIPQNAVSPRPRKARCNLVARIDRPWSPSFRSAMQKVTLEQQIEQKSHAQRTAMLEKVQRPKDDRAVQRMGIEWCQCCAFLGSSIHRFKTRHQSDYEGHEQTSLILLRMMSPRTYISLEW